MTALAGKPEPAILNYDLRPVCEISPEVVLMKVYSGSEIRNVAVVGHNDTGKTTLVSQLLFNTGATTRLGRIEDGTTTTDFDPDEIDRKHSISAAVAYAEWKNTKINLLDTPGFGIFLSRIEDGTTTTDFDPDEIDRKHSISAAVAYAEWKNTKINLLDTPGFGIFLMEAKSAMRVADASAIVVSGVTGVEVTTEKVWKFAEEYGQPRIVIVNKMDRERASAQRTLDALQKKFGKNVVPIQLPMGEEHAFNGVVDLVSMKGRKYATAGRGRFR